MINDLICFIDRWWHWHQSNAVIKSICILTLWMLGLNYSFIYNYSFYFPYISFFMQNLWCSKCWAILLFHALIFSLSISHSNIFYVLFIMPCPCFFCCVRGNFSISRWISRWTCNIFSVFPLRWTPIVNLHIFFVLIRKEQRKRIENENQWNIMSEI